ncbi:MAG TPA: type II secretion system F family protein [Rhizobiaceae bacterium]|nr:type II secretion system F family protein [Rhizobiaceae bacterium]
MDAIVDIVASWRPTSLAPLAFFLVVMGLAAIGWPFYQHQVQHAETRRRLQVKPREPVLTSDDKERRARKAKETEIANAAAKRAAEFYMKTDPENVARLRLRLMQAGYLHPGAVGIFFLVRFGALLAFAAVALVYLLATSEEPLALKAMLSVIGAAGIGYFMPGFVLSRRISKLTLEYRNGFPDFMDLMIVCSDAGMSLEASIDRVSREIQETYPALARNLALVTLELRAGRPIDETLKSLAERLGLEEVRSFATLLQQSRELGTSLSGALKVFSDEMRHKRMSLAEEKAHALPAKMSIPVTVCILPVIVFLAIIPIIVKFQMGAYNF